MYKKFASRPAFQALILVVACGIWTSLWAQIQAGRIVGLVSDPSQAVIAGAKIIVLDIATNQAHEVVTNSLGEYVVTPLQPATYRITISAPGFQTLVREGIEIQVGQSVRVDGQLPVGDASTRLEVSSEAPLVDTESGSLGQVISDKLVANLPLNGRSFYQLAQMATGAALLPNTNSVSNSIRPNYIAGTTISGVSGGQVGFINNGMDVTDNYGGTAIQTSIDAIEEFKVQQNAYSAEYSRAALFNLTTKSGANRPFGTLFDFLRNDDLDARNFFLKSREVLKRNQFGGTVGAPVVLPHLYNGKNRTFFFVSYEAARASQGIVFNDIVPSQAMLGGNFSGSGQPTLYDPSTTRPAASGSGVVRDPFAGNQIPGSRLSPQALFFDKFIPAPNLTSTTTSFAPARSIGEDQYTIRADHNISDRNRFFAQWSYFNNRLDDPNAYPALARAPLQTGGQNVSASLTSTLNASMVNEARFSFLLSTLDNTPFLAGTNFNQQAAVAGFESILRASSGGSFPDFAWSGYTSLQGSAFDQRPKAQNRKQYQAMDNLTLVKGRHIIKAGLDVRRLVSLGSDSRQYMGSWTFTGLNTQNPASTGGTGSAIADWDLGLPASGQRGFWTNTFGGTGTYWHFFAQDDFKVSSRVTLNLGLRYEYSPWLTGYRGQLGTFDGKSARPLIISSGTDQIDLNAQPAAPVAYGLFGTLMQTTHQAGLPTSVSYNDKTQFAPRFGFAWRPFGERTVIRGGYGMFYEPEGANTRVSINMLPFQLSETVNNSAGVVPNRTLANFFLGQQIGAAGTTPSINATYTHMRMGYDQHWNFGIQQSLPSHSLLEVNYAGDKGSFLQSSNNFNLPAAGPGVVQSRRPYPFLGQSTYFSQDMSSIYHSLQTKAERRLNNGFWTLVSYTYSKNIVRQPTPAVGGNTGWERALASFDIPHAFSASAGYALPFGRGKQYLTHATRLVDTLAGGWQIQGVLVRRSGRPFTPTISRDAANIGISNQRPNRIGSGAVNSPTVSQWFDTSAFAMPAAYTYGNSGAAILREGRLIQLDCSLFKEFGLTEKSRFQFRAEVFNLTNTASFLAPSGVVDTATGGTVTATSNSPRQIQLALKFLF